LHFEKSIKTIAANKQTGKEQMIWVEVVLLEHQVISDIPNPTIRRFHPERAEAAACRH
jgi:hypothetical protein